MADEGNNGKTHFFGKPGDDSEARLKERLENSRNDFEHHLLTTDQDVHEKCRTFITFLTLAFLPDKIVCRLKKDGEILAANVVKEVYERVTEKISGGKDWHRIEEIIQSLTVADEEGELEKNIQDLEAMAKKKPLIPDICVWHLEQSRAKRFLFVKKLLGG